MKALIDLDHSSAELILHSVEGRPSNALRGGYADSTGHVRSSRRRL